MNFLKKDLTIREILIVLLSFFIIFLACILAKNNVKIYSYILNRKVDASILDFTDKKIVLSKNKYLINYKFRIKNKNNLDVKYHLYLENIDDINPKYVQYSLEKNKFKNASKSLNDIDNNFIIDSDIVSSKEVNEYILTMWVDKKYISKLKNNKYNFKLKIYGEESSLYPFQITVTMPRNTKTERNFSYHTNYECDSNIQVVKALNTDKNNIDFLNDKSLMEFSGEQFKDETLDQFVHQIKINKLEPGVKYYYRVGDKKKDIWSNVGEFVTDDGDDNFKFIYISDQQSYVDQIKNTTYAINSAKKTIEDAEFIVNAGDVVNYSTDKEQWKKNLNFSIYGDITTINSVGNHDYNYNGEYINSIINNFYYDYPKQDTNTGIYYSINYGNVHFTILNTNDEFYSKLSDKQLKWLISDLQSESAVNAKYKIILMHRGVYTTGPHYYYHKDILPLTEQLTSVFAQNNVDLVLQGHDHVYSITYPIDEAGNKDSVSYKTIYSKEINSNISAMYDNKSPVYMIADAIGLKHEAQLVYENNSYIVDKKMHKDYSNLLDNNTLNNYFSKFQFIKSPYNSKDERYGIFSSIEVNKKNLIINSYIIDNNNYKDPKLYNSVALAK